MPEGLVVTDLGVDYGGGEVVRGVDLDVRSGEIVALLGPNGAGKTSSLWAIAGLVPSTRGRVLLNGRDLSGRSTDARARAGLVLIPDNRGLFPSLTVGDHLWLAAHRRPSRTQLDDVFGLFPVLAERRKQAAGSLSGGEAQMLTIAMGLVMQPSALLIDELSLGLAPVVVGQLLALCRRLADERKLAIVVVEQFVELALRTADRAVVVADGIVRLRGPAPELLAARDELQQAYLGIAGAG